MKTLLITTILFLFASASIYSQTIGSVGASDAKSMALGNEFTVVSNGIFALGKNPANLVGNADYSVEVATVLPLPNVNVIGGSNFLSLDEFDYFFAGDTGANNQIVSKALTVDDKERFVALFGSENRIHTNVSNTIFAISIYHSKEIGAFAFGIHDQASATSNIPKDMVDLMMFGNQPGRVYDLSEVQLDAWLLRSYSLSYALDLTKIIPLPFKSFHGGISVKYIQGIAYVSLSSGNSSISTDANTYGVNIQSDMAFHSAISPDFGVTYDFEEGTRESNISPFPEPVGTGIGFDIGATSEINRRLSVGFSMTDIGSISWNGQTVEYLSNSAFTLDDLTEDEVVDSLFDTMIGDGHYVDGYSTGLSTALHLGGALKVGKMGREDVHSILLIVGGYHQGFNNLPGNSTNPRFTLGFELRAADWFQIRTGTSFGGRDEFKWAVGLGFDLDALEFNFATTSMNSAVAAEQAKMVSVAIGTRWKF